MTAPRLLLVAFVATLLVVATAGVAAVLEQRSPEPRVASTSAEGSAPTRAVEVLAAWDRRRAEAWADADAEALARLYVPGSEAGRRDRRMLTRWAGRGLRVEDLRVELLGVEVLDTAEHRLVLRVTDRLADARAVGRGLDVTLPDDRPTTRRITLVRHAGEWRVAKVV